MIYPNKILDLLGFFLFELISMSITLHFSLGCLDDSSVFSLSHTPTFNFLPDNNFVY